MDDVLILLDHSKEKKSLIDLFTWTTVKFIIEVIVSFIGSIKTI